VAIRLLFRVVMAFLKSLKDLLWRSWSLTLQIIGVLAIFRT